MNKQTRRTVTFSQEENNKLYKAAKEAGMSPTQYMKAKTLDPSGDSVLRRQVIKVMSQFYATAEKMESIADRKLVEGVAEQLWQSLK